MPFRLKPFWLKAVSIRVEICEKVGARPKELQFISCDMEF